MNSNPLDTIKFSDGSQLNTMSAEGRQWLKIMMKQLLQTGGMEPEDPATGPVVEAAPMVKAAATGVRTRPRRRSWPPSSCQPMVATELWTSPGGSGRW